MFAATTTGWFSIRLETGKTVCRGREGWLVSTIAVANHHVLVTCPELAEVHIMMSWWDNKKEQVKNRHLLAEYRGFWSFRVEAGMLPMQHTARALFSQQESGAWLAKLDEDSIAVESERKVWAGNAKTCAIRKLQGKQMLFLGTEPADVLTSDDMGGTWRGTDTFAAIPER